MHDSPEQPISGIAPGDIEPLSADASQRAALVASHVLMVRPTAFGLNDETQETNAFVDSADDDPDAIRTTAQFEFDGVVSRLRAAGVGVFVFEDDRGLPDSVFPNNWFSWHTTSPGHATVILYPMLAPSRRRELRIEWLEEVAASLGVTLDHIVRLDAEAEKGRFLESTGSMVIDRRGRRIYACRSPRTDEGLVREVGAVLGFDVHPFDGVDSAGVPVYHTNVIMAVQESFAVVCDESVRDAGERAALIGSLRDAGKETIRISLDQAMRFAGNIIQLRDGTGSHASTDRVIAMSRSAWEAFDDAQRHTLSRHGRIVAPAIDTIERIGGGSVRCMIAEVGN
ncbi:MAG: arginine deiminase-related protein [Phycisphaerales bacterium JB065]